MRLLALILAFSAGTLLATPQPDTAALSKKIDSILEKSWQKQKIKGNPAVDDQTFVRRIYLDVAGRIPTYREAETFLKSTDKDKRARLIDELLAGEGYVQHSFNYWADILRAQSGGQAGGVASAAYLKFIKDSLRDNKPYDQFVREMVAAQGYSWDNGAIGYYMRDRGMPLDNMASTVRIFLGTRIECAQCHNHPFDKWTQKEFYQMAAFTFGMDSSEYGGDAVQGVQDKMKQEVQMLRKEHAGGAKNASKKDKDELNNAQEQLRKLHRSYTEVLREVRDPLRYTSVNFNDRRKLTLPHDYQYTDAKPKSTVAPATMMGTRMEAGLGENAVESYAKWMTSPENPRFTNVIANRLWKRAFGAALIEPVDELMENTQATDPVLMTHLEELMKSLNYDMKAYLRVLYNTRAYQRAVSREELVAGMPYYFPGPVLRRMSAEQMWDSFVTLINPTPDMVNESVNAQGAAAVASAQTLSDALNAYGSDAIYAGLKGAADKVTSYNTESKELQKQITAAREAGDKEKAKELTGKLNKLGRTVRDDVRATIMEPARAKLASLRKDVTAKAGDAAPAMMMMEGVESSTMMSADAGEKKKDRDGGLSKALEKQFTEEANYYGITDPKDIRRYFAARRTNARTWLRSAEIGSPAPRGHYLRIFGQSDRELIENANHDASVPQALALMNSQLLPQIMSQNSSLMLSLGRMPYETEKMKAIYMTLLTRQPTDRETEIWAKASDKGLTSLEDLIYALINTQQFIFIQ